MRWIIAVGLVTVVVGIGGAGYGVWSIWKQHDVITSARPVKAKVVAHDTEELKASGFAAAVPLVQYEYTVNQKAYTCDTVTPDELMLPDTWAESVFKQFPVGAQVEARYDPDDPSKAFLIGKYSIKPYLPLLVSLVIAAMGLGVVGEQLANRQVPVMTGAESGSIGLGAKQHHLTRARVFGMVGLVGLICGGPAIAHHLMMSTPPHERMGFLLEGAYAIAVLVVLGHSGLQFRQGYGFGAPVVTVDRSPEIGQTVQVNVSVPTRFKGTASLNARLKCEAQDRRLFNFSDDNPDRVLLEQTYRLCDSEAVGRGGEMRGAVEVMIPSGMPPSTPVSSGERIHVVWSLMVTAEGSGGRKAETEYVLSVMDGVG